MVKNRAGASVNAYLILRKGDEVLLQLRKNTGYFDGMWSFVAGHVEDNEPGTLGLIREAKEEIGIDLLPSEVQIVHIIHRRTDRLNVDLFFESKSWSGEIRNCEPEKCGGLAFFPVTALPENIIDFNAYVLDVVQKKEFYSEKGWKEESLRK